MVDSRCRAENEAVRRGGLASPWNSFTNPLWILGERAYDWKQQFLHLYWRVYSLGPGEGAQGAKWLLCKYWDLSLSLNTHAKAARHHRVRYSPRVEVREQKWVNPGGQKW